VHQTCLQHVKTFTICTHVLWITSGACPADISTHYMDTLDSGNTSVRPANRHGPRGSDTLFPPESRPGTVNTHTLCSMHTQLSIHMYVVSIHMYGLSIHIPCALSINTHPCSFSRFIRDSCMCVGACVGVCVRVCVRV